MSDNDSNIIHVVWYFLMLYNCPVVLLSCTISTIGCIAINILSLSLYNTTLSTLYNETERSKETHVYSV